MRCKFLMALLVALLLLAAPAAAEVAGKTDQEVQAAAELLLDNLLAGFNDGDYPRYSRDFDQMLKEAIPAAKFQQVRGDILKKLGKYQARQYLGFLSQGQFTVVLWKGRFAATDNDVLIKLAVSKRLDRTVVTGLWFQ